MARTVSPTANRPSAINASKRAARSCSAWRISLSSASAPSRPGSPSFAGGSAAIADATASLTKLRMAAISGAVASTPSRPSRPSLGAGRLATAFPTSFSTAAIRSAGSKLAPVLPGSPSLPSVPSRIVAKRLSIARDITASCSRTSAMNARCSAARSCSARSASRTKPATTFSTSQTILSTCSRKSGPIAETTADVVCSIIRPPMKKSEPYGSPAAIYWAMPPATD